jgi:hypothetical protein
MQIASHELMIVPLRTMRALDQKMASSVANSHDADLRQHRTESPQALVETSLDGPEWDVQRLGDLGLGELQDVGEMDDPLLLDRQVLDRGCDLPLLPRRLLVPGSDEIDTIGSSTGVGVRSLARPRSEVTLRATPKIHEPAAPLVGS